MNKNKNTTLSPNMEDYFHDDISNFDSLDMSEQSFVDNKHLTAPFFERIPVFSEPPQEHGRGVSSASSPRRPNTNPHSARRPNSSRLNSSSTKMPAGASPKPKNNSLENRILLKIASFMPNDELVANANSTFNKLSASRNDLIQLNTTLDEITVEIRETEAAQGNVLFNNAHLDFNDIPEQTMQHLDNYAFKNGEIMYDTIMSDLIQQAMKKITRIRRYYRNRFKSIEDAGKVRFHKMELHVQSLEAALHKAEAERVLYLRAAQEVRHLTGAANVSNDQPSVSLGSGVFNESPNVALSTTTSEDDQKASRYGSLVSAVMGEPEGAPDSEEHAANSKHATMAQSLASILQTERKESLGRLSSLSTELVETQRDLQSANKQIQELKNQLMERDRQIVELNRLSVAAAVQQLATSTKSDDTPDANNTAVSDSREQ